MKTVTLLLMVLMSMASVIGCSEEDEPSLIEMEKAFRQLFQRQLTDGDMTVRRMNQHLSVVLTEPLLFDVGSDDITPKGLDVVKQIASVFKKGPLKEIRVTGHGDSLTTTDRSKEFFLTLASSKARATHVVRVLKESGVDPGELYIEWYGDIRPVASNGTQEGRQRNRRIEIGVSLFTPMPVAGT